MISDGLYSFTHPETGKIINYDKDGDEAVKFFIENPLNFGPFGRVYPLEEPEKFIALAPAYYSPFFQWIKE